MVEKSILSVAPSGADEPPPPYQPSNDEAASPPNPGFCPHAFRERAANSIPGGGMAPSRYFARCPGCAYTLPSTTIPAAYQTGWLDWIDPSINFRWESHLPAQKGRERLSCWICWEYEGRFVEGMSSEGWYRHMRRHFFVEGYRICRGKTRTGAMQRRRNCEARSCPKIHS